MLLRQLRRVVVSFNPLAAGALPAREFLARLAGKKARQSNPQCAVEPDLRDGAAPPHVYVEFGEWSTPRRPAGGRTGGRARAKAGGGGLTPWPTPPPWVSLACMGGGGGEWM